MPDPINWSLSLPYYLAALLPSDICLGSIPFGLLSSRALPAWATSASIGSGNIGATNVCARGARAWPPLTLLADMLKGARRRLGGTPMGLDTGVCAGSGRFWGICFRFGCAFAAARALPPTSAWRSDCSGRWRSSSAPSGSPLPLLTRYSSLSALVGQLGEPRCAIGDSSASSLPNCSR